MFDCCCCVASPTSMPCEAVHAFTSVDAVDGGAELPSIAGRLHSGFSAPASKGAFGNSFGPSPTPLAPPREIEAGADGVQLRSILPYAVSHDCSPEEAVAAVILADEAARQVGLMRAEAALAKELAVAAVASLQVDSPGGFEVLEQAKSVWMEDLVRKFTVKAWRGVACTLVDAASGKAMQARYVIDKELRYFTIAWDSRGVTESYPVASLTAVHTFEEVGVARNRRLSEPVRRAATEGQWAALLLMMIFTPDVHANGRGVGVLLLEDDARGFATCMRILRVYARFRDPDKYPAIRRGRMKNGCTVSAVGEWVDI